MFGDIGAGIIVAFLVATGFNIPYEPVFLASGVFFAIVMDVDFIAFMFNTDTGRFAHKHRDILHYPLIYIPLGSALVYFILGPIYTILFIAASLIHFIHDSIGIGWGVQWLFPFTSKHYMFLYMYTPPGKEKMKYKLVHSWKHEEIDALAEAYGDDDWIKNVYFRLSPYALLEFAIFALGIATLFIALSA